MTVFDDPADGLDFSLYREAQATQWVSGKCLIASAPPNIGSS